MEGIPAILLGVIVFWALSDNPREARLAEGRGASLAAGEAGSRTAGGGGSKEGKSLAGAGQPQNLDAVDRVFWGLDHDVRSHVVAAQRDPIAVGPQLLPDGTGVGASVRGDRDCDGSGRNALGSHKGAALAHGDSRLRWSGRSGGCGVWQLSGRGGCLHRPWAGLRRVDGGAFLGDGDFANGWAFGSRGDRGDQLAGESGRVFWSRYYRILSQTEWRVSRRAAGDRGDLGSQWRNRVDCGARAEGS